LYTLFNSQLPSKSYLSETCCFRFHQQQILLKTFTMNQKMPLVKALHLLINLL